jgi:hypothetical protein
LGSRTERENLTGDAKGKGASGANREAESTDAPGRGGLPGDDPSITDAMWVEGVRKNFAGKIVVGRDLMTI